MSEAYQRTVLASAYSAATIGQIDNADSFPQGEPFWEARTPRELDAVMLTATRHEDRFIAAFTGATESEIWG